jgi:rod shape-determining protein MreC
MVHRWWQKHSLQVILGLSSIAIAWLIFQTRGAAILEAFSLFVRNLESHSENERELILANSLFQELQDKITDLEAENQELKKLLKYNQTSQNHLQTAVISAPIIGRNPDEWWKLITIGAGSREGVQKDYIVTGIGGLVGRIVEVTPHTSRVLLISDFSSSVGAMISRTRYMGFIKGNSSQTATMTFYAKVSDVQIGDLVTTSPISTIFPPSIPIGKVVSINLNKSPAPEATVKFTAPLDFLAWVTVYPK